METVLIDVAVNANMLGVISQNSQATNRKVALREVFVRAKLHLVEFDGVPHPLHRRCALYNGERRKAARAHRGGLGTRRTSCKLATVTSVLRTPREYAKILTSISKVFIAIYLSCYILFCNYCTNVCHTLYSNPSFISQLMYSLSRILLITEQSLKYSLLQIGPTQIFKV